MSKLVKVTGGILGAMAGECVAIPYIFMRSKTLMYHAPEICWELHEFNELSRMIMAGIEAIHRHGIQWDAWVRCYHKYLSKGDVELDIISAKSFGEKRLPAHLLKERELNREIGAMCSGQVLLRQIPLVIAGLNWDEETLFEQVASEVAITHTNPEVIELARMFALCLQSILKGCSRVEIWDKLFAHTMSARCYRTVLSSYYEKPVCDRLNYSYAHVTLQLALYHYWHDTPFVSAIRSAVLLGGATDVNAAAVGTLLGATHGAVCIPEIWRSQMLEDYENPMVIQLQKTLHRAEQIVLRTSMAKSLVWGWLKPSRKTRHDKISSRRVIRHPHLLSQLKNQESCGINHECRLK